MQGILREAGRMLGMEHMCLNAGISNASPPQELSLSLNDGQAGLGASLRVEAGDSASCPALCSHQNRKISDYGQRGWNWKDPITSSYVPSLSLRSLLILLAASVSQIETL